MSNNLKAFNVRIPKSLWAYVKKLSVDRDESMNSLLIGILEKHKRKSEKKLTKNDANVE
jgi:hypothetical protein